MSFSEREHVAARVTQEDDDKDEWFIVKVIHFDRETRDLKENVVGTLSLNILLSRYKTAMHLLARDLKSFELKTTFEDVFPAEATSVEEYLQQAHEMAMVSVVQEAQKDNLRNFSGYTMAVLEDDCQKEKKGFSSQCEPHFKRKRVKLRG
ncbi:putative nucleoporin interacting component [Helianthus annuus]|nr:putative nucleoporin interacting component [Helianthus annuus]